MNPNEKESHLHPPIDFNDFEGLLQKASDLRGHRCLGLPLGIKMAQMGIKLLNFSEEEKNEYLLVFVETDKCPADGIQVATGCSAGSRKLRMMYYGKSAATFVDCRTGKGYRVVEKKDLAARAVDQAIKDGIVKAGEVVERNSKRERSVLMNAFMKLTPEELFDSQSVKVDLEPCLTSKHQPHNCCSECGEEIMGGMGVVVGDKVFCKSCLSGPYYQRLV
jgi:Formylmethanofuran dehydrogenase subunit E